MAAYPSVDGPYGFKPINLLGGLPYAGSTRLIPIQYGFATDIFYGDFVKEVRGFVTRASVTTGTTNNQVTGVFLGCSYTNPLTRQRQFAQYWPSGTLAGDAVAYVVDDPNVAFRVAVCSATTVMASGSLALIGNNLSGINNTGSTLTGNSLNAILAPTATPVTTILPFRCVDVIRDTAIAVSATGSSSGTTLTLTGSGAPRALPVGTDVAYLASNGQVIQTGSFVATAVAAGGTAVTLDSAIAVPGGVVAIPASSTVIFTIYPEIVVKINALVHGYTSSTAV